jgi:hypothetical protein
MAEKNYPPQPEPLKEGESWPETQKADRHEHRWQGFRGGGGRVTMCAICGKAKDEEVIEEQAPTPEPVEIKDTK